MIDRRPRTATVTAAVGADTFGLPVFVFRPFVEARPEVAWKLLEAMADRLARRRISLIKIGEQLAREQSLKATASRPRPVALRRLIRSSERPSSTRSCSCAIRIAG